MKMLRVTVFFLGVLGVAGLSPAQTFGGPLPVPLPIPDGAQGPCALGSTPAVVAFTVPGGVPSITSLVVTAGISHTWYGDVTFTIMGPTGLMVTLLGPPVPCVGFEDSSDLGGLYLFDDGAPQSADAAAAALGAGAIIPPGAYQGDNSLLAAFAGTSPAGTWTFTFTDRALNDLGSVNHASISINCLTESSTVSQPGGAGSPTLFVDQGCPGTTFARILVLGTGGVPSGWFFGLDIPLAALTTELTFGYPFTGVVPPSGIDVFSLAPNVLPVNTAISSVGIHFDLNGLPNFIRPAATHVIQ